MFRVYRFWLLRQNSCGIKQACRYTSTKSSDPLRILFCGSDDFSVASLRALYKLHETEPSLIRSIDVVCRPPKKTGRGLKHLREVPASATARELGLPLHHIDTFRGWAPPKYTTCGAADKDDSGQINLVVAVSFGLLVPPRILGAAKYGGLNVHPSSLPDFRGAAPIEHTLLAHCKSTRVTLQTLHPSKMDHGKILLQWPPTGFEIPRPDSIRPAELIELLAPLGAIMLIHGIRNNLYVPPIQDLTPHLTKEQEGQLQKAPKILPDDCRIRWNEWTASEILRRHRVIGPLWNEIDIGDERVRVTFSEGFTLLEEDIPDSIVPPALPILQIRGHGTASMLRCKTVDGKILGLSRLKVPGRGEQAATAWARRVQLFNSDRSHEIHLGAHGDFALSSSVFE